MYFVVCVNVDMCDELYEAKKNRTRVIYIQMLIQPCHILLYESEREREKKDGEKSF
jgi:hypothetical protein